MVLCESVFASSVFVCELKPILGDLPPVVDCLGWVCPAKDLMYE